MPNTLIFMSREEDLIHPLNNHVSIFIFSERKYKKDLVMPKVVILFLQELSSFHNTKHINNLLIDQTEVRHRRNHIYT